MMRKKKLNWTILLTLVLTLMLAACGGEAATDTPKPEPTQPPKVEPTEPPKAEPTEAPTAVPTEEPAATGPQQGGDLVVATQADAATLDPHNSSDVPSSMVIQHMVEPLLQWTEEGTIGPGLATDWSFSDDGLTLTLNLREGVKFHDGSDFNADVAKYNFDRILDPENNLRWRPQLETIESVDAPDDVTIVLNLKETYGAIIPVGPAPFSLSAGTPKKRSLSRPLTGIMVADRI
jgi:peptide/nickel transport system substrate-binding protein